MNKIAITFLRTNFKNINSKYERQIIIFFAIIGFLTSLFFGPIEINKKNSIFPNETVETIYCFVVKSSIGLIVGSTISQVYSFSLSIIVILSAVFKRAIMKLLLTKLDSNNPEHLLLVGNLLELGGKNNNLCLKDLLDEKTLSELLFANDQEETQKLGFTQSEYNQLRSFLLKKNQKLLN
jgi:hypothetical protein